MVEYQENNATTIRDKRKKGGGGVEVKKRGKVRLEARRTGKGPKKPDREWNGQPRIAGGPLRQTF